MRDQDRKNAARAPEDLDPPDAATTEGTELRERVVQAVDDVRMDKVERICRKMASGEYRVDAARLAERILAALDR